MVPIYIRPIKIYLFGITFPKFLGTFDLAEIVYDIYTVLVENLKNKFQIR